MLLLRWTLLLTGALTAVCAGMIVCGAFSLPHPALSSMELCGETLCWMNVHAGETRLTDAAEHLLALGYQRVSRVHFQAPTGSSDCDVAFGVDDQIVRAMYLTCTDVRLGDLAAVFGDPSGLAFTSAGDQVLFVGSLVSAMAEWSSPRGRVTQIALYEPTLEANRTRAWLGFLPRAVYCRRESEVIRC